ncbi:pseudouridine synthase [Cellvibrio zantedeschiae]|uniref:Pseudouridine synthase n=1 Tax=Cellvibrio zantedeschiae TaxID=1237077 RepID=A0ABQ3AXR7_9GAMM|nr:16S rRNA pseudouridine(516) synthase RsuA [Cellvibrio zantedeschiae]GGY71116.1 pseudouridine synthase [Cellvibrio zantedeschiae]
MRLDKFIGNNSELSRTQIHIAIKQGLITVNDQLINKTNTQINTGDKVICNGEIIEERKLRYLMLHKPAGYVSANSDSEHPTLLDLIDLPFKHELQIAGRLDLDTTGLVLLTDDGQWNHKITSPKHMHTKSYLVTTVNAITKDLIVSFAEGLLLKGETKKTLPAELSILDSHQARLSICEGKYHQVKRMFAAVGNHVIALHRERIGAIHLDDNLQPGKFRSLTSDEIASFEK